jgi:hypothetical protein
MSDNLLAGILGALEGANRTVQPYMQAKFEDQLATKRRQQLMQDELSMLPQRQAIQEQSALRTAQAQGDINLNNQKQLASYNATLPVKTNPDDFISGEDINSLLSGNIDPNKKYPKSAIPIIQKRNEALLAKKSTVVPGFDSDGTVTIEDAEAKKLRDGLAEFKSFKAGIKEYRELIGKYGTTEILDRGGSAKLKAVAKNLQLKVKNLAQLGVLSASDIPFIEEQIRSPGVLTTASGTLGALDQTEKLSNKSFREQMSARGYKPGKEMEMELSSGNSASGLTPEEDAELAQLESKYGSK